MTTHDPAIPSTTESGAPQGHQSALYEDLEDVPLPGVEMLGTSTPTSADAVSPTRPPMDTGCSR